MKRSIRVLLLLVVPPLVIAATSGLWGVSAQQPATSPSAPLPAPSSPTPERTTLNRYCVGCHNERAKASAGGLALDAVDVTRVAEHAEVLEKVIRKLRAGQMPPPGRPRPEKAVLDNLATHFENALDQTAAARPNPGRTEAFHRLNRAEYRNVVRDLLAVDVDVASLLPIDDAGYGFDNIAGVLKISQSQMEQYLAAARKISRAALGGQLPMPVVQEFKVPETQPQYDHIDGLPFGTRGGMRLDYNFPQDGEYEFTIDLLCRLQGECDGSIQFADPHQMEVSIDGARIELFTLEPRREMRPIEQRRWRVRTPVTAGPHQLIVTFLKIASYREADTTIERFLKPHYNTGNIGDNNQVIYQPFLDRVTITGPFSSTGTGETPSRRAILTCRATRAAEEPPCAKRILSDLAKRAFRRPVTDADVEPLLRFYRDGRRNNAGFDAGIEMAVRRLLVSPEFLFRVERDPAGVAANATYRITDLELASRLSFFLWSSIPDVELLDLAARGRLKDPAVLERQVRRMIADPRSTAFVTNFAGQWLQLRNLDAMPAIQMDYSLFPNFDDGVRLGFRRETEMFVESILRENRGIMELLTADYTFMNERLARHYGIPDVYGDRFRRVTLTDPNRRGLLGHGSILTVTSRPNRTSPVLRGKWILGNILGTPPPDPPANVPAFPEEGVGNHGKVMTVRERLAAHRKNPVCAGCHNMIDPPGFALENYDAVGRWRDVDRAFTAIDASGALADGTTFDGVAGFRAAIVKTPEVFVSTFTEKVLTYALGRGLEAYDKPAIRRIVRETAPGHKISDVILGVVKSVPFQMRTSLADTAPAVAERRSSPLAPFAAVRGSSPGTTGSSQ